MTRLSWGDIGTRTYQMGVDRAVLFVGNQPGVAWSGITSVTENPTGGVAQPLYLDGEKYSNLATPEEYDATLTAYTYPDEFEVCDGTVSARTGLMVTRQKRKPFSLAYRTNVGTDLDQDAGYRIHLIYNVTAAPSNRPFKSSAFNTDAVDFSWKLTSLPPITPGYKRTSHIILDSRKLTSQVLSAVEDILYGTDADISRLPNLAELTDLVDTNATLTVVDHGDGTFSVTAPMSMLTSPTPQTYQVDSSSVTILTSNTYSISSP